MEKAMTLFNKDHPVLQAVYDDELHKFIKISDTYDLRYAPPGIIDNTGFPNRRTLNSWWEHRAIPASRQHLKNDFPYLDSVLSLPEHNMGLSLSDRYWVTDRADLRWKDVNFFENPFSDDLGMITLGEKQQSNDSSENLFSPDSTLNGDLRKKWTIQDGQRILLKSGSGPFYQEPYNEVIATMLHKALLQDGDFVPYELQTKYSACPDLLGQDEELVPMWDILQHRKKPNDRNDFQFCLQLCTECGIPGDTVLSCFEKMFTCDFILANHDRHYRNFGLIRNVETLKYTRMAPVYDTGSCLWHDKLELNRPSDFSYMAKPFGRDGMEPEKQLKLFHDFSWFNESRLDGFTSQAAQILLENPLMTKERMNKITERLKQNMEYAADYICRRRDR